MKVKIEWSEDIECEGTIEVDIAAVVAWLNEDRADDDGDLATEDDVTGTEVLDYLSSTGDDQDWHPLVEESRIQCGFRRLDKVALPVDR